jgi:hypothetical protein
MATRRIWTQPATEVNINTKTIKPHRFCGHGLKISQKSHKTTSFLRRWVKNFTKTIKPHRFCGDGLKISQKKHKTTSFLRPRVKYFYVAPAAAALVPPKLQYFVAIKIVKMNSS